MQFSYPDAVIGRVSGEYAGYRNSAELVVSVRVEKSRGIAETTDHDLTWNPLRLSISAGVRNRQKTDFIMVGQIRDALDNMVSYAQGWDAQKVARLREIWDMWHLNDMNAECVHQSKANHETCENGYEWGTAWLVRELPEAIVLELQEMMEVGRLANVW
jgi:hypothetical protein